MIAKFLHGFGIAVLHLRGVYLRAMDGCRSREEDGRVGERIVMRENACLSF